jgi:hypothetical protein
MILKDLNVGEKFYPKSKEGKATPIFEVFDKHTGMSGKIRCINLQTGAKVNKMGKLEVIRTK